MMFRATRRTQSIEYTIRDVLTFAKKLEQQGRKILYLNIGDPCKYDFETPEYIKKALMKAVEEGNNWYAPSEGLPELREAICEKESTVNGVSIQADDVIVTQGISEGIQMLMAAIVEAGDEVLVQGQRIHPTCRM
ncbi:MAG TPA: aminotransferase class I/II-fold pyridoxal phosphate-dependent enzyme [Candidatus Bathyarchaeia archaeon]|nr:aminotransferase class I/II-fold pyridoxal phosphate-dependent enzyme [Candidatus Bathyarchaeia archaeon]